MELSLFALLAAACVNQSDESTLTQEAEATGQSTGTSDASTSSDTTDTADTGGGIDVDALPDGSFVCRPAGVGPFPAVLYNHGGLGTALGGDLQGTCEALAESGYLARSQKRSETVEIVGHLEEVLTALTALREHPDADTSRVGIMGFSRGGLLTLQAALAQPQNVMASIIMAPAPAMTMLEDALMDVSAISAPVRVHVAENDIFMADHVSFSMDVEAALNAAGKDVALTIHPPWGDDGHELFFEVREPYWSEVIAFLDETLGE